MYSHPMRTSISQRDSARMTTEPVSTSITISDPLGLHLRVGKDLVKVANQYHCTITAENLSRPSPVVDVKSILQLMQLQARQGHTLRLAAAGPDAQDAISAVCQLFVPGDEAD
jgi:phosphotransferase system HPr (HPr) family protein